MPDIIHAASGSHAKQVSHLRVALVTETFAPEGVHQADICAPDRVAPRIQFGESADLLGFGVGFFLAVDHGRVSDGLRVTLWASPLRGAVCIPMQQPLQQRMMERTHIRNALIESAACYFGT